MEVIYTGLHQTPEQIAETVVQEDADAVGISILSGAHMTLVPRILELLHAAGADDVLVVAGGDDPDRRREGAARARRRRHLHAGRADEHDRRVPARGTGGLNVLSAASNGRCYARSGPVRALELLSRSTRRVACGRTGRKLCVKIAVCVKEVPDATAARRNRTRPRAGSTARVSERSTRSTRTPSRRALRLKEVSRRQRQRDRRDLQGPGDGAAHARQGAVARRGPGRADHGPRRSPAPTSR